jgi:hypothetical protein
MKNKRADAHARRRPQRHCSHPRQGHAVTQPLGWAASTQGAEETEPRAVVQERISGPVAGYYFAVYAAGNRRDGFIAYAKICREKPADVWCCEALKKASGFGSTATSAMAAAERRACRMLQGWAGGRGAATLLSRRSFWAFAACAMLACAVAAATTYFFASEFCRRC